MALLLSAPPPGPLTLSWGISRSRNLPPLGRAGWALGSRAPPPAHLTKTPRLAAPCGTRPGLPEGLRLLPFQPRSWSEPGVGWLFSKDLETEWIKERIQVTEQSVQEEPALFHSPDSLLFKVSNNTQVYLTTLLSGPVCVEPFPGQFFGLIASSF